MRNWPHIYVALTPVNVSNSRLSKSVDMNSAEQNTNQPFLSEDIQTHFFLIYWKAAGTQSSRFWISYSRFVPAVSFEFRSWTATWIIAAVTHWLLSLSLSLLTAQFNLKVIVLPSFPRSYPSFSLHFGGFHAEEANFHLLKDQFFFSFIFYYLPLPHFWPFSYSSFAVLSYFIELSTIRETNFLRNT